MAVQDQKRKLIIDAAVKRFQRYGLAKTTMEEIARDLDISKGSLYYYFADKDSIYVAAIEQIVNTVFEDISAFTKTTSSMKAVQERYQMLKEKVLSDYHFLFGIHEWISDRPSSLMRQVSDLVEQSEIQFLSQWIEKGQALGEVSKEHDPGKVAMILAGTLFGNWVVWCKRQGNELDLQNREKLQEYMQLENTLLNIFFRGLR
ncbi:hypothetical protein COR50_03610 [Chitinophaga caeni]|uniref:HTH tetR-type domain-containing protein n=1 Tax=Chitinophaga caeni TaxID=2029983 RepID=A0A291QR09_9BACT|nr:TetR/AcrR family transcriptional regulator [Chitinophaga caeni]ATL46333.1 hypothetical protein COR50_03610 [Chitinophaga caeni]